jgi:hypothetical protein
LRGRAEAVEHACPDLEVVAGEVALELDAEVAAGIALQAIPGSGILQKRPGAAVQGQMARRALKRITGEGHEHLAGLDGEQVIAERLPLTEGVLDEEAGGQVLGSVSQPGVVRLEEEAHVLGDVARQDEPNAAEKHILGIALADRILVVVRPCLELEPEPEVHGVVDLDNDLCGGRRGQQDEREDGRERETEGARDSGWHPFLLVTSTASGVEHSRCAIRSHDGYLCPWFP